MGFDFDIDARIRHRETGEILSADSQFQSPSADGYVDICSWMSRMFLDHRAAIIGICNQYSDKTFSIFSYAIPVPKAALRPICAYLYSRCCVPDTEPELQNWNYRQSYEATNLPRAENLHELIVAMDCIAAENKDCGAGEMLIPDMEKRTRFQENPQDYEIEFMIFNHCSDDRFPVQPEIRQLKPEELEGAMALVLRTFLKYEAPDYSPEGVQEFRDTLHNRQYLSRLTLFGAFLGDSLTGVGAYRDSSHIALLFVDSLYHRCGIGRAILHHIIAECNAPIITVNSSPYAVSFYRKIGFQDTDTEQCVNGLRFIPMKLEKTND